MLLQQAARWGAWVFGGLLMASGVSAWGQAQPAVNLDDVSELLTEPPMVPASGINLAIGLSTQHNSSTGWTSVMSPLLSYRFPKGFSVMAGVPWYLELNNYVQKTVGSTTTYPLTAARNMIGDATVGGSYDHPLGDFGLSSSATVGFATGNDKFGLTANSTTFNLSQHVDYAVRWFNPDIEVGYGNSSSLAHQSTKKTYTAVGPLANFQAGTSIELPWHLSLDLEAYENLPIGDQRVYGTVTTKKNGKTVTTQVLQGTGVAEDNGFTAELDVPLWPQLQVHGSYERSLRQGLDTAQMGLVWTLRGPRPAGPTK